jgi:hypothetical protein
MDWPMRSAGYPNRGDGDDDFVAITEEYLVTG